MRKFQGIGLLVALAAVMVFADSNSALAQRRGISFGGSNNNNNNNNNNNQGGNRRNRDQDDNDKNSNVEQFQELFQGGQGGQGNQNNGNSQQFRRSGQQGGQPFQNSQQLQNIQQQFGKGNNNWQKQKYSRHNDLQKWVVGFNGGPRPFSNDWYKNHPQAWKHNHHHNHDAWEIASAAGVVGWLGWQAARPHTHTVYIYDPVPVETVIVDGQPQVVIEPATGEWLTLGTYSLMTAAGDPGTRVLQLSIDKHGHIRGSYYDMITNGTHNVIGVIDQNTQQARWTLDTNQQLTFVTTLDQLTQSQGVVNVKLPGGQVQQWQLVRMENGAN